VTPAHSSATSGPKPTSTRVVLVRGLGDDGSAVAHSLFADKWRVVLHDDPQPTTPRRGMAFADAMYDGVATLEGIAARRVETATDLRASLDQIDWIPVTALPIDEVARVILPALAVDAQMRKRAVPESQRELAPLAIGLGPGFVAGDQVDIAIETDWERAGQIVRSGPTAPLAGEPRAIAGIARDRYVYAPVPGTLRTTRHIGDLVGAAEPVARIDETQIFAPVSGAIRGLVHDGVTVERGAKVLEIDPRGPNAIVTGIGERPRRIAEGVLSAVAEYMERDWQGM
jgi:xanthine dehydrogenase accessory factor